MVVPRRKLIFEYRFRGVTHLKFRKRWRSTTLELLPSLLQPAFGMQHNIETWPSQEIMAISWVHGESSTWWRKFKLAVVQSNWRTSNQMKVRVHTWQTIPRKSAVKLISVHQNKEIIFNGSQSSIFEHPWRLKYCTPFKLFTHRLFKTKMVPFVVSENLSLITSCTQSESLPSFC